MDADDEETKTMQAVELPEQALELAFHPSRDVIASGLLDGKVCLYLCTHRCPSTCGRVGRQQQQL